VQATKATLFEAELNRAAGDTVRSPAPDPSKAQAYLKDALAVARLGTLRGDGHGAALARLKMPLPTLLEAQRAVPIAYLKPAER
jgi:hypothetical protein